MHLQCPICGRPGQWACCVVLQAAAAYSTCPQAGCIHSHDAWLSDSKRAFLCEDPKNAIFHASQSLTQPVTDRQKINGYYLKVLNAQHVG